MNAQCMGVSLLKQDFFFALGLSYQAALFYCKPLTEYPTNGWNLVFTLCKNKNSKKKRRERQREKRKERKKLGTIPYLS